VGEVLGLGISYYPGFTHPGSNMAMRVTHWIPLAGAMYEVDQQPTYCDVVESYLMTSCKCVAIFPPSEATVRA
jgi:hypothetical protein